MQIMLKAGGIVRLLWDSELRKDVPLVFPYEEALQFMTWPVVSVEGATVGSLVRILKSNLDLYMTMLDAPHLDAVLSEKLKESKTDWDKDLDKVQICWMCDQHDYNDIKNLELLPTAGGVGPAKDGEHSNMSTGEVFYGLDFTPMVGCLHLPLSMDEEVRMSTSKKGSDGEYEFEDVYLGLKNFTLFDILRAVVEEFTFFGLPSSRDAIMDELVRRKNDFDTGKGEYLSWDEVKKKLNEQGDEKTHETDGV